MRTVLTWVLIFGVWALMALVWLLLDIVVKKVATWRRGERA